MANLAQVMEISLVMVEGVPEPLEQEKIHVDHLGWVLVRV